MAGQGMPFRNPIAAADSIREAVARKSASEEYLRRREKRTAIATVGCDGTAGLAAALRVQVESLTTSLPRETTGWLGPLVVARSQAVARAGQIISKS